MQKTSGEMSKRQRIVNQYAKAFYLSVINGVKLKKVV